MYVFGTVNKNSSDEHPFCTIDPLYDAKSYETVQAIIVFTKIFFHILARLCAMQWMR